MTLPYEADIDEKDRKFGKFDDPNFTKLVIVPASVFCLHAVIMYQINFVFAKKRIAERNYETMYAYFSAQKGCAKIIFFFGEKHGPKVFVATQVVTFLSTMTLGWLNLYSFYCNTFFVCFWLTWSIWNASCFYMDYFAKKYEASMQKLEQLEQELVEGKGSSRSAQDKK